MMRKKIVFMLCALLATATICMAKDNGDKKAQREARRTEMAKKFTERMKSELSLTDEQAAKVEALNKEYMPKMRMGHPGMRGKKTNGQKGVSPKKRDKKNSGVKELPEAKKAQCPEREKMMKEARKEYREKLNEILTPEQQEKYKNMRKERRVKNKK